MTDTVKLEPCNCPECGGRKPCSELDTPKHKMPTHDEWAKNGTEWYISRLQWRLQKAEDLLNTRPAPTPAPDRVCICGHSKADHSEKHGMECSEECTCLKYTPAPDRDAVREALAEFIRALEAGTITTDHRGKVYGQHFGQSFLDKMKRALTPSHPSAGRDEVREAADEMFRTAVCRNAGTDPFTGQAFTECGACPLCKARVAYKQALATPQGKEDAS